MVSNSSCAKWDLETRFVLDTDCPTYGVEAISTNLSVEKILVVLATTSVFHPMGAITPKLNNITLIPSSPFLLVIVYFIGNK